MVPEKCAVVAGGERLELLFVFNSLVPKLWLAQPCNITPPSHFASLG